MEMQGNNVINFVAHLQFHDSTLAIRIEELREPTLRQKKEKAKKRRSQRAVDDRRGVDYEIITEINPPGHSSSDSCCSRKSTPPNGIAATVGHQPALIKECTEDGNVIACPSVYALDDTSIRLIFGVVVSVREMHFLRHALGMEFSFAFNLPHSCTAVQVNKSVVML